jgi:hypothetical protein
MNTRWNQDSSVSSSGARSCDPEDDRERSGTGNTITSLERAGHPASLGPHWFLSKSILKKGMMPCGQLMKHGAKLEKSEFN